VLVRDIPVFRRHGHDGLRQFPERADPATLAEAILDALAECHRDSVRPFLADWTVTAEQVATALTLKAP
jgi:hypothetical protein